jgi:hypothetical protein
MRLMLIGDEPTMDKASLKRVLQRELKASELTIVTRDEVSENVRTLIPDTITLMSLAEFLGLSPE